MFKKNVLDFIIIFNLDEKQANSTKIGLKNVIEKSWKSGLIKNAVWIKDNLIWMDSYGNIQKLSPDLRLTVVVSNQSLVSINQINNTVK